MSRKLFDSFSSSVVTSARAFDSGLPAPIRTLITNAIIAKLTPLLLPGLGGDPGGFLEMIVGLDFTVQHANDELGIDLLCQALANRSPAIAVATAELKSKQAGGPGRSIGELEVDLLFVSTHRKDTMVGRATTDAIAAAGDAADPGVFASLEYARARLFDADLGVGTHVKELKLDSEFHVATTSDMTIWKQEWKVVVGRDANMSRGVKTKLTSLRTTLKPVGDEPVAKHMVEDTTLG